MLVLVLFVAVGCRTIGIDPGLAMQGTRVHVDRAAEGSPVVVRDDHLVVVREGRLFSVRIGGGRLEPVDMLELEPTRGHDMQHDELRLHGDTVIVVRERWVRGHEHVDIARVRIESNGELVQIDAHTIPGSRVIASSSAPPVIVDGDRLHLYVWTFAPSAGAHLPPIERRRSHRAASRALRGLLDGAIVAEGLDLQATHVHAVVACDLAGVALDCSTRAIRGGSTAEFRVAPDAIYLWTNSPENRGALVRFGLDGGPVSVLPVSGEPVDGDAWRVRDGRVDAFVRNAGTDPDLFDYGAIAAPLTGPVSYVDLADPQEQGVLRARLVGDTFVYGAGNGGGWVPRDRALRRARLWIHAIDGETRSIDLSHSVEAIAALNDDAIVVGTRDSALHLSTIELDGGPRVRAELALPVRSGEQMTTRGLYVEPERGVVGIPMLFGDLVGGSRRRIEMAYFGLADREPRTLGAVSLPLGPAAPCRKRCGAGPSRPVFHEGRMFAMLRHALAEIAVRNGELVELDKADLRALE